MNSAAADWQSTKSTMIDDDIVLKTQDLTKHYGGVHALEGADFELQRGEHVAIMGDNGAGKSTFVRQITGVEQRTRGKIWLYGKEVNFCLLYTSPSPRDS